jgi:hypothetical protein
VIIKETEVSILGPEPLTREDVCSAATGLDVDM